MSFQDLLFAIQRRRVPVASRVFRFRGGPAKRILYLATFFIILGIWFANRFQPTNIQDDPIQLPSKDSKSNFHLLITTSASTTRTTLCQCLISAAILDYPPPTLVNYERSVRLRRGRENVQDIYDFLTGKEVGGDDVVLIVSESTWLQLPPQVTISRFLQANRDTNSRLLKQWVPKYTQNVLFGAAKRFSNHPRDPSSAAVPMSPLSDDLYDQINTASGRYGNPKYKHPRFLSSNTVIGKAKDLIPVYKYALELLMATDQEGYQSQQAISQVFGEQEAHRRWKGSGSSNIFLHGYFQNKFKNLAPPNETTHEGVRNYEFGIGLDYESSIFQLMDDSEDDVRFVTFNGPTIVASPSKLEKFKKPIKLPMYLLSKSTRRPFALSSPSGTNVTGKSYWHTIPWSEVSLATNIIVPGSRIPSMLDFHETAKFQFEGWPSHLFNPDFRNVLTNLTSLRVAWWPNMWFAGRSRALMQSYLNISNSIGADESAGWDNRGGRGGVWTGSGEWLAWKEVCGGVDGLYKDGRPDLDEMSDEGVVRNSFGNIVEGDDGGKGFEGLRFQGGGV